MFACPCYVHLAPDVNEGYHCWPKVGKGGGGWPLTSPPPLHFSAIKLSLVAAQFKCFVCLAWTVSWAKGLGINLRSLGGHMRNFYYSASYNTPAMKSLSLSSNRAMFQTAAGAALGTLVADDWCLFQVWRPGTAAAAGQAHDRRPHLAAGQGRPDLWPVGYAGHRPAGERCGHVCVPSRVHWQRHSDQCLRAGRHRWDAADAVADDAADAKAHSLELSPHCGITSFVTIQKRLMNVCVGKISI